MTFLLRETTIVSPCASSCLSNSQRFQEIATSNMRYVVYSEMHVPLRLLHASDLSKDCVIAREISRIPSIAGTLRITLFTTVNGRLSSSWKINFGAQK